MMQIKWGKVNTKQGVDWECAEQVQGIHSFIHSFIHTSRMCMCLPWGQALRLSDETKQTSPRPDEVYFFGEGICPWVLEAGVTHRSG